MKLTQAEREALTLWQVPRWTRATVAGRLGLSYDHMDQACLIYCQGRKLLSDFDVDVLRQRRRRGQNRPTPQELQAQVQAAGPGGILLGKEQP